MHAASAAHVVQFYESEDFLRDVAGRFVEGGLAAGERVVIIAAEARRRAIRERLRAAGHDVERASRDGRITLVDARETLAKVMVGATPDRERFLAVVGGAMRTAAARRPEAGLRAYGELVDVLSRDGAREAAIQLEDLWNDLARTVPFQLMCAYSLDGFDRAEHAAAFGRICAAHADVFPTEACPDGDPDDRRRAIAALQQRARALEAEVSHRRELEAALLVALADLRRSEERLREADRRKDEFLAMLGHELRNPLGPILTGLQLMQLRGVCGDQEQQVIERQVRHLVRLVDDLLDVSRVTRGTVRLEKERVEISAVLAKAIEIASPICEQRSHALSIEVPREGLPVEADPVRLAQVFASLLTNAAKYTDPGGHISVAASRDAGEVVVSVKDDGMGISPEVLPWVFDLFVQAERTLDRSQGGLGIGLTLARSLVERHGGTVQARSGGPGLGSEFLVRLPAAAPARREDGAERDRAVAARPRLAPLRILLVDDNSDAAELLADALRSCGHEVAVAYDGLEALSIAADFRPDAAILDIGLPSMDGYELARKLRASMENRPPRLIALTGYGQDGDRARSRSAGFDVHLVKPVDLGAVIDLFAEDRGVVAAGERNPAASA